MPRRNLRLLAADHLVEAGLAEIRTQMEIPERFSDRVEAEIRELEPVLPDRDMTEVPFLTIDPRGSRDLDQALAIEQRRGGYRIRYAIADVPAFVQPGGAVDEEAWERGQTLYGPDRRTPLYPSQISEGGASLLPDVDRPSQVWEIDLDRDGEVVGGHVAKAMVRSRAQLSYEEAQEQIDQATGTETLRLLAEVGRLREMQEVSRDAVTLDTPEQQIVARPGGWALRYRAPLPVEGWNAQISILTGIFAAGLMVEAGRGMLRTLPPSPPERIQRLRRVARGLRIAWPEHLGYPDLIRSLNARIPAHAAFLTEATGLFTGAGYQVLGDGEKPRPHSALATIYSHVTAPLRRLADRYVGEACLAICENRPLPEWVGASLPALPEVMARSASLAGRYEAECLNLVEAALLSGRIGEVFAGIVIEVDRGKPTGDVQLHDPAVLARVTGEDLDLGEELMVRLADVSVEQRRVEFSQT